MKIIATGRTSNKRGCIDSIRLSFNYSNIALTENKCKEILWDESSHFIAEEKEEYTGMLRGIYYPQDNDSDFYLNGCLEYFKNCKIEEIVFCTDDDSAFSIEDIIIIDGEEVLVLQKDQFQNANIILADY